ncbi:MAG: hypothetical protein IPQ07_11155 [Myxococcales bacterium]|nr:hypothetical protein [Myxococcales bacterium]
MRSHLVTFPIVSALLGLSLFASTASADDYDDDQPPPPMQPGPPPVYVAPLSQQTQGTYVPQSVALSGPEEITEIGDRQTAPAGYTTVMRARKGLIIGGSVTLGATYLVCAMTAAAGADDARRQATYSDSPGTGKNELSSMWIPIAGPFLQMAHTDSSTANVFLFHLGAAQVAGAIMLYYGLTTQKRVFVRNDLVGNLQLSPMTGNNTTGMALSGQF